MSSYLMQTEHNEWTTQKYKVVFDELNVFAALSYNMLNSECIYI